MFSLFSRIHIDHVEWVVPWSPQFVLRFTSPGSRSSTSLLLVSINVLAPIRVRMCGRFACGLNWDQLSEAIDELLPPNITRLNPASTPQYQPSYNVAPGARFPVIRMESGERSSVLTETMQWGIKSDVLIPSSPLSDRSNRLLINARDDTILKSQSIWKGLVTRQRCVVFCQGFFEWQKVREPSVQRPKRVAHFIGMSQEGKGREALDGSSRQLMPMAAFWSPTEDKQDCAFTIVTTPNNKQLDFLHDRMPLILPDVKALALWLGCFSDEQDVLKLMQPFDGPLECYQVPPDVGTVGTSKKSYIYPLWSRKDSVMAAFQNAKGYSHESKVNTNSTSDYVLPEVKGPKNEHAFGQDPKTKASTSMRQDDQQYSPPHKRVKRTCTLESLWKKNKQGS